MKKKQNAIKWLIEKAGKEKFKLFLLILSNAVFSVLSVAFAFAVKLIIDGATVDNSKDKIIAGVIFISAVVILQFAFRVIIQSLTERIRARLEISYRTKIFNGAISKNYKGITDYHTGEVMNRLTSDINVVCDGVTTIIPTVVSAVVRLVCAIVALIFLEPIFAIAFVVAGVLVYVIMAFTRKKLKHYHKKVQETDGKTRSFFQECLENILTLKVFSARSEITKKSKDLQEENYKVKMKRKNYSVIGHASYNLIFSLGYVFALVYGAFKIFGGATGFGYGSLSAVLQLVNNVQVPFMSLSSVLPKYYSTIASTERLLEIENLPEEKPLRNIEDLRENYTAITVNGLNFSYGEESVIEDANFTIKRGDFAVISGRSGIGKSTLFKVLLGVYKASGKVCFDTNSKSVVIDETTRKMFSFVPQGNMLFSGTILDNITFYKNNYKKEDIDWALSVAEAKDFVDSLPNNVNTVIGENGLGLSEGQVQRLAIARALITKPAILLLDESTSALDTITEEKLIKSLKEIKDLTVIMISHKPYAVSGCDTEIVIKDKKVIQKTIN
jgi:ATP-binding cassette subfamily B protein